MRHDLALQGTAVRFAGSETPWDPGLFQLTVDEYRPGKPVEIEARVAMDHSALRAKAVQGDKRPVILVAVARCAATRWNHELKRWILVTESDSVPDEPIKFVVDGDLVAQKFDLTFQACLGEDREGPRHVARHRWNVLAEKKFEVLLEPGGNEFPTEWVSFKKRNLPTAGLWHLEFEPANADLRPQEAVKMLLNQDAKSFRELLGSAGRRPETRLARNVTLRYIATSCVLDLVGSVLAAAEVEPPEDPEDRKETLWPRIFHLCKKVFEDGWDEDDPLESLKRIRKENTPLPVNLVNTAVQDAAGLNAQLARLLNR